MPVHKLPELPYAYDALEPYIDARTMEIHHGRHHQTYVDNLNKTLEGHADLQDRTVENLIADLDSVPETIRTAVRNNGGGHANHSFFWSIMKPRGGGRPVGDLAGAVARELGGFDSLRDQLTKAGLGRFGSGWAWLSFDEGRLLVESTANQDSPLSLGRAPVLAVDVWEHAYYLKYQNRRAEYLEAWWNTIDWQAVSDRYDQLCGMTR